MTSSNGSPVSDSSGKGSDLWTEPPTHARQGRQLQRYGANGARLVAGCLPVRWCVTGVRSYETVQVLLISSRGGKGMVFPKGGWETDETMESAACRETVEEAGVRGVLEGEILGVFPFVSKKGSDPQSTQKNCCLAHMFVMNVLEELDDWPESAERIRVWCSPEEAYHRLRHDWMRTVLHQWIRRNGWELSSELPLRKPEGSGVASTDSAQAASEQSVTHGVPLAQRA
uniref:Nudix hydrolase n=1 Tax=Tetraselmis sp. GSL018 TaxID=582737 RepID=A0A061RAN9_9CHLO|mmetsp:Transcript_10160/g.24258  ORF Transcript_10160/g.24258 Transcript_10160/m.24258 type:complete len:228 (+) Transcript_10160:722-1405(+)